MSAPRAALAPRDDNNNMRHDPFFSAAPAKAGRVVKGGNAGVITFSRRRAKNIAAKQKTDADKLASDMATLAVKGKDALSDEEVEEEEEDSTETFDGPYSSDSDCGGPGTAVKKAEERKKAFLSRAERVARDAAKDKDDAAHKVKLAEQRVFFERVDQISLASESASPSVASVHRRRVFENGDKTQELMASAAAIDAVVAAERVDADEPADPHRPAPTTPGTKRMLTSEWLNAMPATFSPAMSDAGMSYAASPAAGVPASVPEEPEVEAAAEEEATVFNLDEADEDAATVEVATTRAPSIAPSDEEDEEDEDEEPGPVPAARAPSVARSTRRSSAATTLATLREEDAPAEDDEVEVEVEVEVEAVPTQDTVGDLPPRRSSASVHPMVRRKSSLAMARRVSSALVPLGRRSGSGSMDRRNRPSLAAARASVGRQSSVPDIMHATLEEEEEEEEEDVEVVIEEEFLETEEEIDSEDDEVEVTAPEKEAEAEDSDDEVEVVEPEPAPEPEAIVLLDSDDEETVAAPTPKTAVKAHVRVKTEHDVEAITQAIAAVAIKTEPVSKSQFPEFVKAEPLEGEVKVEIKQEEDEVSPLAALLRECGQSERDVLPMEEVISRFTSSGALKIGEGTYGEAFKCGGNVLKIVPMGGDVLINGEPQMGPGQIRAEAAIAKRLTRLRPDYQAAEAAEFKAMTGVKCELPPHSTEGFINTAAVTVCRGPYAPPLLNAWKKYDKERESENENPEGFPADQLYIVFACADGGADLEHIQLNNAAEATAMLLQVTVALAVAEEAMKFEHRDLHWGNVLLQRCGVDETRRARLNGVELTYPTNGLAVNIIDFTLSRLDMGDGKEDVAFCDLEADPELFEGPAGHCQSDTYRRMRKATKGTWERHCPKTNALWLHYLADCLLSDKEFPMTAGQKADLKGFKKRAMGYKSANEALWDNMFVGVWRSSRV
jgi:serine/threonine-protein kinase haspin